jgi:hypothetical protein
VLNTSQTVAILTNFVIIEAFKFRKAMKAMKVMKVMKAIEAIEAIEKW